MKKTEEKEENEETMKEKERMEEQGQEKGKRKEPQEKSSIEARSNNQRKKHWHCFEQTISFSNKGEKQQGDKRRNSSERKHRNQDLKENIPERFRNDETTHRKREKQEEKKRRLNIWGRRKKRKEKKKWREEEIKEHFKKES